MGIIANGTDIVNTSKGPKKAPMISTSGRQLLKVRITNVATVKQAKARRQNVFSFRHFVIQTKEREAAMPVADASATPKLPTLTPVVYLW